MTKIRILLAILFSLSLLAFPAIALADNAPASDLGFDLEWGEGININATHNTWYSADRHWVAHVYEGDVWVSYTADYGSNWTNAKVIDEGNTTFRGLSVWYDEPRDIVHFARVADGNITGNQTDIIYHSSYTPTSVGLVEVEGEVAVEDGLYVDGDVGTVTIACDENGYPFIAWTEAEYTTPPTLDDHYWVEVSDSDTNDGTWVELSNDAFYEFDNTGAAMLGHDYDTLYGDGNWSAIAVNLCPIGAAGDLMQLAWSLEEVNGTDTAGIDSTIWDDSSWGNLSWVVPMDAVYGLFTTTMGEIEFDFYDIGSTIHCVYADVAGDLNYNAKSAIQDWDDINGPGNWTEILDFVGFPFPSLSGYEAALAGEDLICVYHDYDSLYYKTKAYGAAWDANWTTIWDVDDYTANPASGIFMQNTQYKYGAGSPVGFAWTWGTLEWGNGTQTGELDYWWIDQDGEDAGENPLGWVENIPSGNFGSITYLVWIVALLLCFVAIANAFRMMNDGEDAKKSVIVMIAWIVGIMVVAMIISVLQ